MTSDPASAPAAMIFYHGESVVQHAVELLGTLEALKRQLTECGSTNSAIGGLLDRIAYCQNNLATANDRLENALLPIYPAIARTDPGTDDN